jgi:hypothetical protein
MYDLEMEDRLSNTEAVDRLQLFCLWMPVLREDLNLGHLPLGRVQIPKRTKHSARRSMKLG